MLEPHGKFRELKCRFVLGPRVIRLSLLEFELGNGKKIIIIL